MAEIDQFFEHFPREIGPEIKQYATEEVFKNSRYIFTHRHGKRQYGYCTHCNQEFMTDRFIHNTKEQCPKCGSVCTVKASGRGHKYMVDEAYFVYYEKSLINPEAIIARGIYAVRDYSECYTHVETKYLIRAYYVFEMGNNTMINRYGFYSQAKSMTAFEFVKNSSVFSLFSYYSSKVRSIRLACSWESIEKAVAGTQFRFSAWESYYRHSDMVKYFDLYSRYPCVEYLMKLGFEGLVVGKLSGGRTFNTINWRAKSLFKVLRIGKKEFNEIRTQKIDVTFLFLKLLQLSQKDGSNLSPVEIEQIENSDICRYLDYFLKILRYTSMRKAISYIQHQRDKQAKYFPSRSQVMISWNDYIADCIKLQMDLSSESVLFPRNLYTAHQNTIKQIRLKADEELNKKINQRIKVLRKKYSFEYQGLLLRPAESTNELIDEGKALNHCVGTYADRYASGQTVILLIRKVSEPDKAYFTIEVKDNEVIQVRGFKNCNPDNKVKEFVEAFKEGKLQVKKAKAKVAIPA